MATRNLARTIVEGGRSIHSKRDRRARNRRERRFRFDLEGDVVGGKVKRAQRKDFDDRLNPLQRWLGRQVGRGWNNIYREFCERFDRRTMKGSHLDDHLRAMVGQGGCGCGGFFLVDARGILRRSPFDRARPLIVSPADEARALDWAAGRQVIVRGEVPFWTAGPIDSVVTTSAQGRRLTVEEIDFWSSLAPQLRQTLTYDAEANRRRRAKADEMRSSPWAGCSPQSSASR